MHKIIRAAAVASVLTLAFSSAAHAQAHFAFESHGAIWNPSAQRAWLSLAQLEARAKSVASEAALVQSGGQNGQAVITEFLKDTRGAISPP